MKIVFALEVLPIPQTGNEYYKPGMDADFRDGAAQWLIEQGYAELLDEQTEAAPPPPMEDAREPKPNYAAMKLSELRPLADRAGIDISRMLKAEIVAALESTR